jgi:hypothetical protein
MLERPCCQICFENFNAERKDHSWLGISHYEASSIERLGILAIFRPQPKDQPRSVSVSLGGRSMPELIRLRASFFEQLG